MGSPTSHHPSLQVHHLDLASKLPWLRDEKALKKEEDKIGDSVEVNVGTEEAGVGAEDGSSELHTLNKKDQLSGDISGHSLHIYQAPPTDPTHNSNMGDSLFQSHNGMDPSFPLLPPKDYDLSPTDLPPLDLPPRDYPMSPDHVKPQEWTGDLISDDDYYAQMMNDINM